MHISPGRTRRARRRADARRGQGLVEFAISFPIVLLLVLFGVDFGRVFLGWITLTNAVREAANFAAINPTAWGTPGSPSAITEYERLLTAEAAGINCALPSPLPDPSFPSGTDVGFPAVVSVTCQFSLITPMIGLIVGNPLDVTSSAAFPIRRGVIDGTPTGGTLPSFGSFQPTDSPVPTIASPPASVDPLASVDPGASIDPGASVGPGVSVAPTASPGPTVPPTCVVPDLKNLDSSAATGIWTSRGFAANSLTFNPLVPPHYQIKKQTLTKDAVVPCTSTMTVAPTP